MGKEVREGLEKSQREFLLRVRRGEVGRREVLRTIESQESALVHELRHGELPDDPQREKAENFAVVTYLVRSARG